MFPKQRAYYMEGFALLDFKTDHKALVIKSVSYWGRDRNIDHGRERYPCIFRNLFASMKKMDYSVNNAGNFHMEKK